MSKSKGKVSEITLLFCASFYQKSLTAKVEVVESSTPVPEPSTMLLLGSGLLGLVGLRRKFKK